MLEVNQITVMVNGFRLKDISFTVKTGLVAVLGPNGSGKTTLLKTLAGIYRPFTGEVFFNGHNLHLMSSTQRARLIGYMPQRTTVPYGFTVKEFVVTGLSPYLGFFSRPQKRHYQMVIKYLKKLGIEHLQDRYLHQLSGGEMQLVRLARVLVKRPQLLLLDEPITFVDLKNQLVIIRILKRLALKGVPLLITLHEPNLASFYADKVVMLKDGCLLAKGSPQETFTQELIKKLYDIPLKIIQVEGQKVVLKI